MTDDKRYFLLQGVSKDNHNVGYVDSTGVYFTDTEPTRYENLHDLIISTGASGFQWACYMLPLPEEMKNYRQGPLGLTKSEALIYHMLLTACDSDYPYVTRNEFELFMEKELKAKGGAFYAIVSRLRKKMEHSESVEYKRDFGYFLVRS